MLLLFYRTLMCRFAFQFFNAFNVTSTFDEYHQTLVLGIVLHKEMRCHSCPSVERIAKLNLRSLTL